MQQTITLDAFSIGRVGLEVHIPEKEITEEQWELQLRTTADSESACQWAISDLLRLAMRLWGWPAKEVYDRAQAITGYARQTLQNLAWVGGKFPVSRRRESVPIAHYYTVAALSPDDAVAWLKEAADNGWSEDELRARVREHTFLTFGPDVVSLNEKARGLHARPAPAWSGTGKVYVSLDGLVTIRLEGGERPLPGQYRIEMYPEEK